MWEKNPQLDVGVRGQQYSHKEKSREKASQKHQREGSSPHVPAIARGRKKKKGAGW